MSFSSLRPAADRASVAVAYAASALLLLSGCGGEDLAPGPSAGTRTSSSTAAVTGSTCQSAGPHQKHVALGFSCETCHPCANDYGFGSFTFPGGTTTAGGTMTRSGGSVTCSVGCHSPFGAPAQPIAWDAGPLECTSCHSGATTPPGGIVSSHGDAAMTNCTECHDQTRHTKGEVILFPGNGPGTTATCIGCHSGQGQTLAGRTPPLLVGWTDTVNGDFHGARLGTCRIDRYKQTPTGQVYYETEYYQPCGSAGPNDQNVVPTGFGGSLEAPFVRNQGALECEECHGVHASSNSFLLAAVVNDTVIPPGAIDRAGVGAETLCNACHQGDRHEACKSCHREGILEDYEGFRWFDPATPVVDPAPEGTACFLCHGHEGIQHMDDFFPETPDPSTFQNPQHTWLGRSNVFQYPGAPVIRQGGYSYAPAPYYLPWYPRQPTPPVFLYPSGTVFDVTATSASIYWETNEPGTSYVEYGVETAGYVTGATPFSYVSSDPSDPRRLGTIHRVELTGLAPDTTYVWRVRTSDAFRNVTEGPLQTFRTTNPDGPPAPALVREPDQYDSGGSGNDPTVTWVAEPLTWNPVTSPTGNPVEYRMQLGTDHTFASFAVDTGWTTATSYPLTITANLASCTQWYWRVMAKDAVTGEQSIWSTETYSVCVGDPYNDY